LAQGIDTSAHVGAVEANGQTIGVVGSDLFSIHSSENRILADQICENGAIFSEHPFTTLPTSANLIQRNRIISGLSMATIVVESAENDGAIRTAQFAKEQNRLVFAYRWPKRHRLSEGPHRLIQQQEALPISPDDLDEVVEALKDLDGQPVQSTEVSVEQMELF
jgi:DNA processing protein